LKATFAIQTAGYRFRSAVRIQVNKALQFDSQLLSAQVRGEHSSAILRPSLDSSRAGRPRLSLMECACGLDQDQP
jgi:hypothetical protein